LAGFFLWLRHRKESLLLWFSIFAVCPAIWTSPYTMRLPVSGQFIQFLAQPLWTLRNVALWFLLIEMLRLRDRRGLVRWAKILAVVSLTASFLDGCLTYTHELDLITGQRRDRWNSYPDHCTVPAVPVGAGGKRLPPET
jgi:hypothetical protein